MSMPSGGFHLIGIAGMYAGKNIPMNTTQVMFGRDPVSCQIIFPDGTQGVSRHHCVIRFNSESRMFVIHDVGSSHGTFLLNGTKVGSTPMAINSGERFYLGSQSNMFEVRS
jgi:pSer/pThr/pTyr-binding forkhead associated (FHA) protein